MGVVRWATTKTYDVMWCDGNWTICMKSWQEWFCRLAIDHHKESGQFGNSGNCPDIYDMAQVSRSSVVQQAQYNQIPQYTLGKCNQGIFDLHLRHVLSLFLEEMASSKIGSWWSRSSSEWSNSVIGRRSLPELGISPHHTLIISSCTTWRSPTGQPTGDQPTNCTSVNQPVIPYSNWHVPQTSWHC